MISNGRYNLSYFSRIHTHIIQNSESHYCSTLTMVVTINYISYIMHISCNFG